MPARLLLFIALISLGGCGKSLVFQDRRLPCPHEKPITGEELGAMASEPKTLAELKRQARASIYTLEAWDKARDECDQ